MNQFNFIKNFWDIAKLYWLGNEKKGALAILALLIIFLLGYTELSVMLNTQQGALISALSAQDAERFWQTVWRFLGVLIIYVPLFAGSAYFQDKLGLFWRRWLTNSFLDRYFQERAFYNLSNFHQEIDNPDQRIAEDIRSFTQDSLRFFLVIVQSVLQVIAFSSVLWVISQKLVIFLVIYAVVGTLVTAGFFGKILVKLNFEQLKKEANFRFGLVRIRENSESIAFYRGENQEKHQVINLFLLEMGIVIQEYPLKLFQNL